MSDLSHLVEILRSNRVLSARDTFYIEMENLTQNENFMESGKDFVFRQERIATFNLYREHEDPPFASHSTVTLLARFRG